MSTENDKKLRDLMDKVSIAEEIIKDFSENPDFAHQYYFNEKTISKWILCLIHFNFNGMVIKHMFTEWEDTSAQFQANENDYLNLANNAKTYHDTIQDDVYSNLLGEMLWFKAGGDEIKCDRIFQVCRKLVADEWENIAGIKCKSF